MYDYRAQNEKDGVRESADITDVFRDNMDLLEFLIASGHLPVSRIGSMSDAGA